jgi:factor associated with neutral sphingomyelinase activation
MRGALSNAEYLLYLNFLGNRSFNDLTQYPVFPWVITDLKSERLNLQNERSYRDLSKPVGALNPDKLEQFKSKYFEILNKAPQLGSSTVQSESEREGGLSLLERPYMYLSHYSTPGIVLYYLIRQVPTYLLTV